MGIANLRGGAGGDRRAWLVTGLAAWLIAGVYLVLAATNQGLIQDVAVSPYHVPAYAALAVLAGYTCLSVARAVRRRRPWRSAMSPGYGSVGLGAVVLVSYVVLDLLWRGTLGIGGGIEGAVAPTRLLLPIGLGLVAAAPLRATLASPDRPGKVPAVLAIALLGAAGSIAILTYNPVVSPWLERGSVPGGYSDIWVMAADGSHQTRVIPAEAGNAVSFPAWSPDSRRLVYTRWHVASGVYSDAQIWTAAADGTDPRRLVSGPSWDWIPAWSPDGAWIAYTAETTASTGAASGAAGPLPAPGPTAQPRAPGAQVWVVRPDGSGAHALISGDSAVPAWSPDGRQIAFVSQRDGTYQIYVAQADGTGERRLTNGDVSHTNPAWSPDGTRIAFDSDATGNQQIWTIGADGSGLTQLTHDRANDQVPVYAPDGRRIAFVSDQSGDPDVWSMAADGSDARDLTNDSSRNDGEWNIAWSPDGRSIAYASTAWAAAQSLAQNDLGVAATLVTTLLLAGLALMLLRLGPPPGAFALVLGIDTAAAAAINTEWRFVPAAVVAGLVVDILVMRVPRPLTDRVAATALPAAYVVGVAATVVVTGKLAWTTTLLLGVITLAGLSGLAVAVLARRLGAIAPEGT